MTGHLDDDTFVGLALGHPGFGDRDIAAHLSGCATCAAALRGFEDAVRLSVTASPSIAPPAGFAERVVAAGRTQPAPPPSRGTSVRWPLLVAAALLVGAVIGAASTLGILTTRDTPVPPQTAVGAPAFPLLTAAGGQVGSAGIADLGNGPVLVLSVTAARPGATYECVLLGEDGSRTGGGTWTVSGPAYGQAASATWLVPVDEAGVTGVELVTPEGQVWASARL